MGHVHITNDRDHKVFVFIRDQLASAASFVRSNSVDRRELAHHFGDKHETDAVRLTVLLRQYWPPQTTPDGTLVGSVDIFANDLVPEDPQPLEIEVDPAIKVALVGPHEERFEFKLGSDRETESRGTWSDLAGYLLGLEDEESVHIWVDVAGDSRSIIFERRSPGCQKLYYRLVEPSASSTARRRGSGELVARAMERKLRELSRRMQDDVSAQRSKRALAVGSVASVKPEPSDSARPTTHEDLLDAYSTRASEHGCGFLLAGELDEAAHVLVNGEPALGQDRFRLQATVSDAGIRARLDSGVELLSSGGTATYIIELAWSSCELQRFGCGVTYYAVDGKHPPAAAIEAAFIELLDGARPSGEQ